jgi:hypothetical protein
MSEATPEAPSVDAPQPPEGEAKTFDADYVDKLRKEAAKYRTEAKTNADAAKRLAEIEDANKSEADKAAERIRALEVDAAEARREALRFKVASRFGVSDEDADLFLTGSDEETLTKQAERLGAREAERKKNGNFVPREGNNPPSTGDQGDLAFARALLSPRE